MNSEKPTNRTGVHYNVSGANDCAQSNGGYHYTRGEERFKPSLVKQSYCHQPLLRIAASSTLSTADLMLHHQKLLHSFLQGCVEKQVNLDADSGLRNSWVKLVAWIRMSLSTVRSRISPASSPTRVMMIRGRAAPTGVA